MVSRIRVTKVGTHCTVYHTGSEVTDLQWMKPTRKDRAGENVIDNLSFPSG